MPFIAERIYKQVGGEKESVHLERWPEASKIDTELIKQMKDIRDAVSLGLMKRTETKINVKQPLLSVTYKQQIKEEFFSLLKDELNVKDVFINESQLEDVVLDTTITEELQKEGDMRKLIRAVQDVRAMKKLQTSDKIVLTVSSRLILGNTDRLFSVCNIEEIKEDVNLSQNNAEQVDFHEHAIYFVVTNVI